MHFMAFSKKMASTTCIDDQSYIQIAFALLYHLPFLFWFGLDAINVDNAASVLFMQVFPSLIAPLLWMIAVQTLVQTEPVFL
jgi:hypothetical protein